MAPKSFRPSIRAGFVDANFAARWFEVDPCYQVMRVLHAIRIIDLDGVPAARLPAEA